MKLKKLKNAISKKKQIVNNPNNSSELFFKKIKKFKVYREIQFSSLDKTKGSHFLILSFFTSVSNVCV
jgi:hypothetical protein